MKIFLLISLYATLVNSFGLQLEDYEANFSAKYGYHPCNFPFYAKSDVPGAQRDATLDINIPANPESTMAILVYSYWDRPHVGRKDADGKITVFCDTEALAALKCQPEELNHFLISPDNDDVMVPGRPGSRHFVAIKEWSIKGNVSKVSYTATKKALYCFISTSYTDLPPAVSTQPYGYLDAVNYPLLPFYGVLSLVYLIIAILWMVKSVYYWRDILRIQHIIGGLLFVIMIDHAFYFGIFDYMNKNPDSSTALFVLTVICNAARNAGTIFVVLIVSMGYGVVKPTLGTEMKKVVALGVSLFCSFLIYNFGTDFTKRRSPLTGLLIVLPAALCLTLSFYWIIIGLGDTIVHLQERRQSYKLTMYMWLRRILLAMITAFILGTLLFGILVANILTSLSAWGSGWNYLWFYQSGWTKIIYLIAFVGIAILWRPTKNNQRYGLEELPEGDQIDLESPQNLGGFGGQSAINRGKRDVLFDASDNEASPERPTASDVYAIGDDAHDDTDDDYEAKQRANEAAKMN